ncbi:hypothetical protein V6N13_011497 [Hibiscus sabdariffa]|uniref:Uncharacterized protein n=1 Tax=Hibiscus sabdariffa TaxID=183260 RepID=A0ABR2SCF2_9ROSI
MNRIKSTFGLVVVLTMASLCAAARPDSLKAVSIPDNNDAGEAFSTPVPEFSNVTDSINEDPVTSLENDDKKWEAIAKGEGGPWAGGPIGDDFGSSAGGPTGGASPGDVNSIVCTEKGPCFNKKLTCPANCFGQVSKSGKGFSASAGGGGCSMDCKTCTATC